VDNFYIDSECKTDIYFMVFLHLCLMVTGYFMIVNAIFWALLLPSNIYRRNCTKIDGDRTRYIWDRIKIILTLFN